MATQNTTNNYDPFAEATKYGYTKEDFINDPGFLNYWKNKTPAELKAGLMRRGDFDVKGGNKVKTTQQVADEGLTGEQKDAISQGHADIDAMVASGEIDKATAAVMHEVFSGDYGSGGSQPTMEELQEITREAAEYAMADNSPYYEEMTRREIEDYKNKMEDITRESRAYTEQEQLNYKQTLASTKKNLRARGLTYSGISRSTLGQEAFSKADTEERENIEGNLPMSRRYMVEASTDAFEQRARNLGTDAERQFGSAGMPKLNSGILDPYNGDNKKYQRGRTTPLYLPAADPNDPRYIGTGDIALAKKKAVEISKQDRIKQSRPY